MKNHQIELMTRENVTWVIDTTQGRLIGKSETGFPLYEFWIGNPPDRFNSTTYNLFVAVCDFAVTCGYLRRIASYAVA